MAVLASGIVCKAGVSDGEILQKALRTLGLNRREVASLGIYKKSVDARHKNDIKITSSVLLELKDKPREEALCKRPDCRSFIEPQPEIAISDKKRDGRTVIAGFGPAGMFCALMLAENGYKPIVLERGAEVGERVKAVESFFSGGELDPETNVQFGEGGAGTFSDGKLTTRINDPLCRYVLKRLREMGAPEEIIYTSNPHIGTDRLREVVKNIRGRIISLGGEIRFLSRLDGISLRSGRVMSAHALGEDISTASLVLAFGHSARDTFEMLLGSGVVMEPKPFSVGSRIEHKQTDVDFSLYGADSRELGLPKGEYRLSERLKNGRAVYTFCMCPGGEVVAASSERGGVVTNGMSRYLRDGENANAALVVSVDKNDFPSGVLGGVDFARSIERRAYRLSGSYFAPSETVGEFLEGVSKPSVSPTYRPGVIKADLADVLPGFVIESMREGLSVFSRRMSCYKDPGAVLTAPETRTSSPVRIPRNGGGTAIGIDNLYPCGEGAGYAGGIMSAAVDGVHTALKIMASYAPYEG